MRLVLKHSLAGLLLWTAAATAFAGSAQAAASLVLETVTTGLERPVAITHAGDGSGRLFITLQRGRIVIFDGQQILPTPFLDITDLVFPIGGITDERGLLSVAFHPNYAANGFFYVNYVNRSNNTVIARYRVSAKDPNVADPESAFTILEIIQPGFVNHKGGQLQFGPDGYLYIGTGDGGGAGDPGNRAQNLGVLLGKMLRIDVDGGDPYAIPPDNPFIKVPGAQPEIWAYGLRNPWRFSFDRATRDLLIGDVGQNRREEIDYQRASSRGGENYGWRLMEGSLCFNPPSDCNDGTLVLPILEYGRALGFAVTGGYVYRGTNVPALAGNYLYGDYGTGRIWGATQNKDGSWTERELDDTPYAISTFGEDEAGEIYFAHHDLSDGAIYRIAGVTMQAQCPGGSWLVLARMNEPRQEMAVAEVDGKIYVVGGLAGRANANEIYDTKTNSWGLGADLPIGNDHAWAVALGGLVYVGGGRSNRVFAYDPRADAWTEVASSIYQHGNTAAAAVIDGLIYAAGGTGSGMSQRELEVYDPVADIWTELAPMSCARNHTTGGAIGGKLYVAGGRPGNQTCLEEYDPAKNTWTIKAPMPTGRSGIAGAVAGNCFYVFGGEGNPNDPNGIFWEVEAYDPLTDTWKQLDPMLTGRHGIYAAVIGNVIYLPGGAIRQGIGPTDINEAYAVGSAPRRVPSPK